MLTIRQHRTVTTPAVREGCRELYSPDWIFVREPEDTLSSRLDNAGARMAFRLGRSHCMGNFEHRCPSAVWKVQERATHCTDAQRQSGAA